VEGVTSLGATEPATGNSALAYPLISHANEISATSGVSHSMATLPVDYCFLRFAKTRFHGNVNAIT